MSILGTANIRGKQIIGWFVLVTLLAATTGMPVMGQEMATINGQVVGPNGEVDSGFKVFLKDIGSGKIIVSEPTGAGGQYSVQVPVGGRYIIDHVTAPDGTVLAVQSIAPIPVRYAGSTRLNVIFQAAPPAPVKKAEVPKKPKPVKKVAKTRKPSSTTQKPWYKKPGGIIGIVLGAGGAIAAAGGGGGSTQNVSPSVAATENEN